jgi:Domain of unknown function (DUF3859)
MRGLPEHVSEKCKPVFRKGNATTQKSRTHPDSTKLGCALAACLLFLPPDDARAQAVQAVEITEFGIYTTDNPTSSAAPGTASGRIDEVSNIKLVQSTATIPARVGVEFGFRYKIVGQPGAAPPPQAGSSILGIQLTAPPPPPIPSVNLKYVTRIPKPGMRNPETGNVTLTNVFYQEHEIGEELYRLYRLTNVGRSCRAPGRWRFGQRAKIIHSSRDFLLKK